MHTNDIPPLKPSQISCFLAKVTVTRRSCWTWHGSKVADGYGTFRLGQRVYRAHRVAFTIFRGAIPFGMALDHTCVNPSCVNPWHLDVVTVGENTSRGALRRTHCRHGHLKTEANERIIMSRGKLIRICRLCYENNYANRRKD
jgi:hypothetical protein